jgi:hypothetical protein
LGHFVIPAAFIGVQKMTGMSTGLARSLFSKIPTCLIAGPAAGRRIG